MNLNTAAAPPVLPSTLRACGRPTHPCVRHSSSCTRPTPRCWRARSIDASFGPRRHRKQLQPCSLQERVRQGLPPTQRHRSLRTHAALAASTHPGAFARPPVCWPQSKAAACTCDACCSAALAAEGSACIRCVLSTAACGGVPRDELKASLRLPRAMGALCVGRLCNTCQARHRTRGADHTERPPAPPAIAQACCTGELARNANRGKSCYDCEASRCPAQATRRGAADGSENRTAPHWSWFGDGWCGLTSRPGRKAECLPPGDNSTPSERGSLAPPRRDAAYELSFASYHRPDRGRHITANSI